MPNVTIYLPPEKIQHHQELTTLTQRYTDYCTTLLQAQLEKVHIIYISATHGYGHSVYIEVTYRQESHRTSAVLNAFMLALDETMHQVMGLTARIRCFGYTPSQIYARH